MNIFGNIKKVIGYNKSSDNQSSIGNLNYPQEGDNSLITENNSTINYLKDESRILKGKYNQLLKENELLKNSIFSESDQGNSNISKIFKEFKSAFFSYDSNSETNQDVKNFKNFLFQHMLLYNSVEEEDIDYLNSLNITNSEWANNKEIFIFKQNLLERSLNQITENLLVCNDLNKFLHENKLIPEKISQNNYNANINNTTSLNEYSKFTNYAKENNKDENTLFDDLNSLNKKNIDIHLKTHSSKGENNQNDQYVKDLILREKEKNIKTVNILETLINDEDNNNHNFFNSENTNLQKNIFHQSNSLLGSNKPKKEAINLDLLLDLNQDNINTDCFSSYISSKNSTFKDSLNNNKLNDNKSKNINNNNTVFSNGAKTVNKENIFDSNKKVLDINTLLKNSLEQNVNPITNNDIALKENVVIPKKPRIKSPLDEEDEEDIDFNNIQTPIKPEVQEKELTKYNPNIDNEMPQNNDRIAMEQATSIDMDKNFKVLNSSVFPSAKMENDLEAGIAQFEIINKSNNIPSKTDTPFNTPINYTHNHGSDNIIPSINLGIK